MNIFLNINFIKDLMNNIIKKKYKDELQLDDCNYDILLNTNIPNILKSFSNK